jgi:hypothetical protein
VVDGVTFGEKWRNKEATDAFFTDVEGVAKIPEVGHFGDVYQSLDVIEKSARYLTDKELKV